jgi:hypothetical protein
MIKHSTVKPARSASLRNVGFFLLLCLALMLVRSIWTFPVTDSDALTKYYFAAEIYRSGDWSLLLHNHHTMRWIEMVPQVFLNHAAGLRYELFYVLPLLVYSLFVTTLLYVLRTELKPGLLLLLFALLFVEPLSFRTSSQLLNPPFGVLFAVLGTVLLVKQGKDSYPAVIGAAVVFVLGYAAHTSYLAFAAGGVAWLVFFQRSYRKSAAFLAAIFSCLVLETLVFNSLSGGELILGRLEALTDTPHMERVFEIPVWSPSLEYVLFERWKDLPRFDFVLSMISFPAAAWLIIRRKALNVPDSVIALSLAGLAYAFLTTVTMIRLDPLEPLVPARSRYLTAYMPFAMLIVVFAFSTLLRQDNRMTRIFPALPAAALLFLLLFSPGIFNHPRDFLIVIRPDAFAWRAHKEYQDLADQVRDGKAIISGSKVHANKLAVIYRYPLQLTEVEGGLGVMHVRNDARCVHTISLVPFSRNYSACFAAER